MIPQIIHYCWFGNAEKPPLVKKCISTWKTYLPDWQIIEWNEDNSPLEVPYVKNAINKKRYAFAADYVRFYALKNFGGVYLDTDMEIIKDISPLLVSSFFIGKESKSFISAGIIGSKKEERIVNLVLNELNLRDSKYFESIPKIITNIIEKENLLADSEIIYDVDYFYPYNPFDEDRDGLNQLFFKDLTQNTYAIHHWNQSWKYTLTERIINRIKAYIK